MTHETAGNNGQNNTTGLDLIRDDKGVEVVKSVIVDRPVSEVYSFWRNLENLPRFMNHLEAVRVYDDTRSHWKAKAPLGASVEWDAEVLEDVPDTRIVWQSTEGAQVDSVGAVRFLPATGGRGTEVQVEMRYRPPAGKVGALVARLLGEEPSVQMDEDLVRFKQVMETGVVA